jgi:hypothetical protein
MKSRLPAAALTITAALFFAGLPAAHAAVVTYIDLLNNPSAQIILTNNATVTNTVASTSAIGGFRTLEFDTKGGQLILGPNFLGVDGDNEQLLLSSPSALATNSFVVKWGGAGGTNGFGPVDFKGGLGTNFSLLNSTLNFSMLVADVSSPFTWSFRDTNNTIASYSGSLPVNLPPNPAMPYAISMASFSNSGLIDWSAINFITLSGGGVAGLDLTLNGAISVTAAPIPEPGTWAAAGLLLLTAVYIRWRRSRVATTPEEAPAAA